MKKNQVTGYRTIVLGMTTIMRLLVYVFVACAIILASREAYHFGYVVFNQEALAPESKAVEINVTITPAMTLEDVGNRLISLGLIDESVTVFKVQAFLSGYRNGFPEGNYILKTSQTVDEMMDIMAAGGSE